ARAADRDARRIGELARARARDPRLAARRADLALGLAVGDPPTERRDEVPARAELVDPGVAAVRDIHGAVLCSHRDPDRRTELPGARSLATERGSRAQQRCLRAAHRGAQRERHGTDKCDPCRALANPALGPPYEDPDKRPACDSVGSTRWSHGEPP